MGIRDEQRRRESLDTLRLYRSLIDDLGERRAFATADLLGLATRGMFDPVEGMERLCAAGFTPRRAATSCKAFRNASEHARKEMAGEA